MNSTDPGIRYFSGIADYTTEFTVGREWFGHNRHGYPDLGSLWAAAEVEVNGCPAGILWKVPDRAEVSAALHPGVNRLRVRVANDWANRLIGDALGPNGKRYTNKRPAGD